MASIHAGGNRGRPQRVLEANNKKTTGTGGKTTPPAATKPVHTGQTTNHNIGQHQVSKPAVNVNVNVNVNVRTYSVTLFAHSFKDHDKHHHHAGQGTTRTPTTVNTSVNTTLLTNGGKTPFTGQSRSTTSPPVYSMGGTTYPTQPMTGNTGGTTAPGTTAVTPNTVSDEDGPQFATETKTTDVAIEDGALLNVRGGNVKLVGQQPKRQPQFEDKGIQVAAFEGKEDGTPQSKPASVPEAGVAPLESGSPSPAASTVSPEQPKKEQGFPVVPSFLGVLTFGATLLVGWKKFR